ncbi:hypothetical protein C8R44DRAFT_869648 [Mycena epipterygia]|nr:hypothetical protein C8R44DRAFT_869648 [Mycena epipterygia]
MTRGRKKDHTIPATRALTLQRDYRARKTQYVADLEARCKAAEAENVRLRKELELLQQSVPQSALSPAVIQASAQLKDTLVAASASLSHFMNVALPSEGGHAMHATPPTYSSATPPSYSTLLALLSSAASAQYRPDENPNPIPISAEPRPRRPARSDSPCCGGYLECDGLIESEEEEDDTAAYPEQDGSHPPSSNLPAISQLRSTSGPCQSSGRCG